MLARWNLTDADPLAISRLGGALGISPLVARLLLNRGLSEPEAAGRFLAPRLADLHDPSLMRGMGAAVARILRAVDNGEKITVWGDYDVDGVTSASLLLLFFRDVRIAADYFIPDRFADGYGLSAERLGDLARGGTTLVITVDCGVSNAAEVAHAAALGVDVIVIDHHHVPDELPQAAALVNPLQPGCEYPYKRMAAAGLTFHLLVALRAALRERGHFAAAPMPDLREYLDIAAIGTVADVVPLTGVNRILTWHGLRRIPMSRRPGVVALCEVSGAKGRPVTAGTVGFQIGPRINAAGRLSRASKGVEMLLSESLEAAMEVAVEVDRENRARRAIEQRMLEEALAQAEGQGDPSARRAFVLASESFHAGVVGIVASKVVERYHRPTVVVALDGGIGKGSARSVEGFHLVDGLGQCGDELLGYGGHAHAAGLTVSADRVASFAARFEAVAREALTDELLVPKLRLDAELRLSDVTFDLVADTDRLAPFGAGNPRPTFVARGVRVVRSRAVSGGHLQLTVEQDGAVQGCIAFRMAERAPAVDSHIDIAFRPELNEWNGQTRIQLQIRDFR